MDYTKEFTPNSSYGIFNYQTDKMEVIKINSRKGVWVNVTLNNRTFDVRVTTITNPKAESLLIDNYCPVYSYQKEIANEYN